MSQSPLARWGSLWNLPGFQLLAPLPEGSEHILNPEAFRLTDARPSRPSLPIPTSLPKKPTPRRQTIERASTHSNTHAARQALEALLTESAKLHERLLKSQVQIEIQD